MPEPITATLVSVSVVSVAVCAYKAIDKMVSAPKELIRQSGDSAEGLVRTFGEEMRKLFGAEPRISIHRQVFQRGGEAIRELALYRETVEINEEWVNTSWKSTKRLKVKQPFTLKAGFDLNRIKFEVDAAGKTIKATITDSTIINVEYAGHFEVIREEHGFWNRINPSERDAILNSLPAKAQEEAEKLQLRDKAAAQLRVFLRQMVPSKFALEIHCTDETLCFVDAKALPGISELTLTKLGMTEEVEKGGDDGS